MKTLIVGLGNPILGDDGVGWRVAEEVKRLLIDDCRLLIDANTTQSPTSTRSVQSQISNLKSQIEVDCLSLGGLSLMERLVGYDCAIVIDAVAAGGPPGAVTCCPLEELPDRFSLHTRSAHDASLQTALQLGRRLNAPLPARVWVVGIESEPVYDFSEQLSPAAAAAVPQAAAAALKILAELAAEEKANDLT